MIYIQLEECFVFDLLSIASVKRLKCEDAAKIEAIKENYSSLVRTLKYNLGPSKYKEVVESKEYKDLYQANLDLFELIDRSHREPGIFLKEVDDLNYRRYLAKKELQQVHFRKDVIETKIGY